MKIKFLTTCLIAAVFFVNCGDNNSTTTENQKDNTSTTQKDQAPTATPVTGDDDIIGEWELVGFIGDTNDNLQLDDDERAKLKSTGYKDYMKFNADGSGLFTVSQMEGRYEAKTNEKGKKQLSWLDKGNGNHRIGTLLSVSKSELLIKEPGGNGLFLWKRL